MAETEARMQYLRRLGAAIENAVGKLPDHFELIIDVERGAGDVSLIDADGQTVDGYEFVGDNLAESIENAVAYARADS